MFERPNFFRLFLPAGLVCATVVGFEASVVSGQRAESQDLGRRAFEAARCQRCHAVSAADISLEDGARVEGPDLSKLSPELRTKPRLDGYLRRTETVRDKKHPFPWRGRDQDLQRLIDWLLEQQSKEEPAAVDIARRRKS